MAKRKRLVLLVDNPDRKKLEEIAVVANEALSTYADRHSEWWGKLDLAIVVRESGKEA